MNKLYFWIAVWAFYSWLAALYTYLAFNTLDIFWIPLKDWYLFFTTIILWVIWALVFKNATRELEIKSAPDSNLEEKIKYIIAFIFFSILNALLFFLIMFLFWTEAWFTSLTFFEIFIVIYTYSNLKKIWN